MIDKPRKWGSILGGIPHSEPPPPENVVRMPPPDLTKQALRIRQLDAALMDTAIEIDRMGMKFNTIRADLMRERTAFLEALKNEGVISEYARTPPEAEFLDSHPTGEAKR